VSQDLEKMRHSSIRGIILVALSLIGLVLVPQALRPVSGSTTWGSSTAIETNAGINLLDTGLLASNGTMWIAWQTNRYRGGSLFDIAYKTNTNGVWSSAQRLTTSGLNAGAAIAQLSNGTIVLFYSTKTGASYLVYYQLYNSPIGWSNPTRISSTTLNDTNVSAAVGRDGTLWLVWTRTNSTCTGSCTDVSKQLYYKTLKSGVWSAETKLTTDNTQQSLDSSVTVGKDNIVRVVYSKGLGSLENYQVYYKTSNGTVWSVETKIVTSTNSEEHPAIMQDRNGTMWLFWQRKIYFSGQLFYYVLMSQFSYNGGTTWLGQTQMTNTSTSIDSMMPFGVQSSFNKSIWVFYTTDPNINDDIYALISSAISPIHDVTITGVSTPSWFQYQGGMPSIGQTGIVSFTVTVLNRGDQSEIITVTLSLSNASSISLGTKQNLATPGGSVNLVFSRNMTRDKLGWYTAFASVAPVPGETIGNQADDNATYVKSVRLIPWGDMDQDGNDNLQDVSVFVYDFGFTPATPSRWNPVLDITNNGVIDLLDVSIAMKNFGIVS
jgi:hypothetical protein